MSGVIVFLWLISCAACFIAGHATAEYEHREREKFDKALDRLVEAARKDGAARAAHPASEA